MVKEKETELKHLYVLKWEAKCSRNVTHEPRLVDFVVALRMKTRTHETHEPAWPSSMDNGVWTWTWSSSHGQACLPLAPRSYTITSVNRWTNENVIVYFVLVTITTININVAGGFTWPYEGNVNLYANQSSCCTLYAPFDTRSGLWTKDMTQANGANFKRILVETRIKVATDKSVAPRRNATKCTIMCCVNEYRNDIALEILNHRACHVYISFWCSGSSNM
jgi:hypothetical protein